MENVAADLQPLHTAVCWETDSPRDFSSEYILRKYCTLFSGYGPPVVV